ncbi:MAG: cell division ATP-binding protein FtsE [Syntrophobacteraceae bacterium]
MTGEASSPPSVSESDAAFKSVIPPAMVECLHVHKAYGQGRGVFRDIEVRIRRGEFVCLTGPGGSGKTTFLYLLTGQEAPDSGIVLVDGLNVQTLGEQKLARFRQRIGVVYQDLKLVPNWTVFENVALPLIALSRSEAVARQRVAQVLSSLRLLDKKTAVCEQLSEGERQRAAIARALVHNPVLILADEPTAHLDEQDKALVWELFRNAHMAGVTILLTAHEASETAALGTMYSLEICDHQLIRHGPVRKS